MEGYLLRLTHPNGKKSGSKRFYFTSHDHLLFYLNPDKSHPPPTPTIHNPDTVDDDSVTSEPLIYSISPSSYAHVQQNVEGSGKFAEDNIKRSIKQIVEAHGFIDLTNVVEVRSAGLSEGIGIQIEREEVINIEEDVEVAGGDGLNIFEIVLKNGLVITLKVVILVYINSI